MGEAQLKFRVKNQIISRTDSFQVVARSHDYLKASFEFITSDWNGINAKTAIFSGTDGKAYVVLLGNDGCCEVPWECIRKQGYMYVSVFGGALITVNRARVFVLQTGYVEETENGLDATPDMAEQIMSYFEDTITTVTDNAQIAQEASEEAQGILEQIQTIATSLAEYEIRVKEYADAALGYKNLAHEYLGQIQDILNEARGIQDDVSQKSTEVQANADAVATAVEEARTIAGRVEQIQTHVDDCKTEIEAQLEEANEIRMAYGDGGTYDDWKD